MFKVDQSILQRSLTHNTGASKPYNAWLQKSALTQDEN